MKIVLSFWISIAISCTLFAQSPVQNKDFFDMDEHIKISFRTSGGYYRAGEPVYLEVWFENISRTGDSYRFYLWKNTFEQWKFKVQSQEGQVPFQTFAYKRWDYDYRNGTRTEAIERYDREITLDDKETFSFRIRLDQYVEFKQVGFYTIKAEFYPLSVYRADYVLPVNRTQIEVRRNFSSLSSLQSQDTGKVLPFQNNSRFEIESSPEKPSESLQDEQRLGLPRSPVETTQRLLRAFKLKRWEEYLSYLQIDALMTNSYRSTDFFERMVTANALERRVIMNEFMDFVVSSSDYDIVTSEILQSIEVGTRARVEVLLTSQEFYQRFREVFNPLTGQLENQWTELATDIPINRSRIFTYELGLVEETWKVTSMEVQLFDGDLAELRSRYALYPEDLDTKKNTELIEKILFDFNQDTLVPKYEALLSDLVEFMLLVRPQANVRLLGFTDDIGSEDYNQELSAKRVSAVRDFLVVRGIATNRIETLARGENNPLNLNQNEEERSENRRVEIYFID